MAVVSTILTSKIKTQKRPTEHDSTKEWNFGNDVLDVCYGSCLTGNKSTAQQLEQTHNVKTMQLNRLPYSG